MHHNHAPGYGNPRLLDLAGNRCHGAGMLEADHSNNGLRDPVAEAFRRVLQDAQPRLQAATSPAAHEPPRPDWIDRLVAAIIRLVRLEK